MVGCRRDVGVTRKYAKALKGLGVSYKFEHREDDFVRGHFARKLLDPLYLVVQLLLVETLQRHADAGKVDLVEYRTKDREHRLVLRYGIRVIDDIKAERVVHPALGFLFPCHRLSHPITLRGLAFMVHCTYGNTK